MYWTLAIVGVVGVVVGVAAMLWRRRHGGPDWLDEGNQWRG